MNYSKYTSLTTGLLLGATVLAMLFISGCWTKRVDGTKTENQPPIVWFSNVPAEGARTSVNPIIYWVGQDVDGQVTTFRYIVIREDIIAAAMGGATLPLDSTTVQNYVNAHLQGAGALPDTSWTYLYVDPLAGQPRTTNIIPMSAEISNPVLKYVSQYVFIQAFDDLNQASTIVFRKFLRNDNPPDTRMVGWVAERPRPFINAVVKGGITTGVPVGWGGEDRIDYPTEAPPFEFQWRMYGPYNDTTFDSIMNGWGNDKQHTKSVKQVFVTNDARIFVFGENQWLKECDTIPNAGGGFDINCDSFFIDAWNVSNEHGRIDTMLVVDDSVFQNHFNTITDSSWDGDQWITDQKDTLYDLFRNAPSPETQQAKFIFWVRCRDDAKVPDLTPSFVSMDVVNPKYEREVVVAWLNNSFALQPSRFAAARHYWTTAIQNWQEQAGLPVSFDSLLDFINPNGTEGYVLQLRALLSHKVIILYGDDVDKGNLTGKAEAPVLTAIDAGVDVWVCSRMPMLAGEDKPAIVEYPVPLNYRLYFGLQAISTSGWDYFANGQHVDPPMRIEDFIGTYSLDTTKWPELTVDTAKLHRNYVWNYDWRPDIGAVPEVNWCVRTFDTEAMYLYKSLYGASHPLGESWSFNGRPVAFRLNRGYFRTAFSTFTPVAMSDSTSQIWINNVMDFLYAPFKSGSTASLETGEPQRQPNENSLLSASILRTNYFLRRQEGWDPHGSIRYYWGQPVTPRIDR